MFVCLGNICRSPMAEFMLKDMAKKKGIAVTVDSSGTSDEEAGNGLHAGAAQKLLAENVPYNNHVARQLKRGDYERYDYFLGMDERNVRAMKRLFDSDPENKVNRLLDYTPEPRDIADPWYTGDFNATYDDIMYGLRYFINELYN